MLDTREAAPATLVHGYAPSPDTIVRRDLVDTHVYVCSPAALVHFSDNYDYQDVRRHYIHNEVLNVDMGWRFNAHILTDAYAALPCDPATYHAVARDVIRRWVSPLVPDANWATAFAAGPAGAWHSPRAGVFVQDGAVVDPDAQLLPGSVVAAGARVGSGAVIRCSVLSSGCSVGSGAHVTDSHVLQGAKVHSGAVVRSSIIGREAVVGTRAVVSSGSVIDASVVISDGHAVPPTARVTVAPVPPSAFGASKAKQPVTAATSDAAVVGAAGGLGRRWPNEDELSDILAAAGDEADSDDEDADDAGAGSRGGIVQRLLGGGSGGGGGASGAGRGAEPGSKQGKTAASDAGLDASAAAVAAFAASLQVWASEHRQGAARRAEGSGAALEALISATRSLLRYPLLSGSAGIDGLDIGVAAAVTTPLATAAGHNPLSAGVHAAAASADRAANAEASAGGSAPVAGGAPVSSSDESMAGGVAAGAASSKRRAGPTWERFVRGVSELLATGPAALEASAVSNLVLEVKCYKSAENRSFADTISVSLPAVLDKLPRPEGAASGPTMAWLKDMKATLASWAPFLSKFIVSVEDERAVVDALEAYCLEPRNASVFYPSFGLLLHTLWDVDVTTDVAITGELFACTRGGLIQDLARVWRQGFHMPSLSTAPDAHRVE